MANTPNSSIERSIPYQHYSFSRVADMFAFPENRGAGQVVGVLGWGPLGSIGIDVSERPYVEIVLIGRQINNENKRGELMMDTLILNNFVPDATIRAYLAIDPEGIVEAVQRATSECNVTTCSFGGPYQDWGTDTVRGVDSALEKALAVGVTPCFASGDYGASKVAYPASSPYALAVGGVFVPTATDPTNSTAHVWWNYVEKGASQVWMASGGGVNTNYAPPPWQLGVMPVTNTGHISRIGRAIPDVAGLGQGLECWEGTSACSPLWASLIARINRQLGYGPQIMPMGVGAVIHDVIYDPLANAGAFTDITLGNNVPPGKGQVGYDAQPGWDACTGWGTPVGTVLMRALKNRLTAVHT
jgi:kumamolisin